MFTSPGAIALQIGPLAIRWYGVVIAAAVMLGTALAHREALRRGQDADALLTAVFLSVLSALLGARLDYVAGHWDYYGMQPAKILALWEGGLAMQGGLLAGLLATVLYCRWTRLSVPVTIDLMTPGIAIGQAVGWWGNFFNQEGFGLPTSVPWKLYVDPYRRPPELKQFDFFHPIFLYESLWNLAVFAILWVGLRKRLERWPGALTLCYLGLYAFGRLLVERFRADSLMLGPLRAAPVVSVLLLIGSGLALSAVLRRRP
jgi:phosphatidylglycerol---prolipoprotein diacylglyceryl transferase